MRKENNMQIIKLSAENIGKWKSQIFPLLKETVIYNFPNSEIPDSYYREEWDEVEKYIKLKRAFVFIAVNYNEVVGWIWTHLIDRFNEKRLHVAFFAVYKEFRRHGVGELLLAAAEEQARNLELQGIDLLVTASNERAVRFYEHHGFNSERYLMHKELKNNT